MRDLQVAPRTGRYSQEFKERAVRVRQLRAETGQRHRTIQRVADQVGCGVESLRTWARQAEIDAGQQWGMTTSEVECAGRAGRMAGASSRPDEFKAGAGPRRPQQS